MSKYTFEAFVCVCVCVCVCIERERERFKFVTSYIKKMIFTN